MPVSGPDGRSATRGRDVPMLALSDVAVTPIAETIRSLWVESLTGELQLRTGRIVKMAFFDQGRPVFAAGNVRKERLGEVLVAQGRISSEQFRRASALVKSDRARFGDALVRTGVMGPEDVGSSVRQWMEGTLVSLFTLRSGALSFEERECPIPASYRVSLSVPQILHDGINFMTNPDLVLAGVGNLDRDVVRTPGFLDVAKSEEEALVLRNARYRVSLRTLVSDARGISFTHLRAAYALLAAGALQELSREGPATTNRAEPDRPASPPAGARKSVRQQLEEDLAHSARLDGEAWLQVLRSAPRAELVRALERKIEWYHALAGQCVDARLMADIELLLGRATSMLRIAQRHPGASAPAPAPVPPRVARAPEPLARPSEPPQTLSMEVDHLLMEGNIGLSVGDFANAIRAFARLVELCPQDPNVRVRLAIAMALWPDTRKDAEGQFQAALRLDPRNPELHYQLGLYYKAIKIASQSLGEFRRVLELDPHHERARAELEAHAPQRSLLDGLRKLLRAD